MTSVWSISFFSETLRLILTQHERTFVEVATRFVKMEHEKPLMSESEAAFVRKRRPARVTVGLLSHNSAA